MPSEPVKCDQHWFRHEDVVHTCYNADGRFCSERLGVMDSEPIADEVVHLLNSRAALAARVRRLEEACVKLRSEWTHKHVINNPLDAAVVGVILALEEK